MFWKMTAGLAQRVPRATWRSEKRGTWAQDAVPFLTKKGCFLPLPVSRSKEPQPNEPPCRDQLKGDSFSVLEMRVKRGRFEVVPHPLPPVSWNVGKGARLKSRKVRQAAQNRLPSLLAFISGGQPISGASMCFDCLTVIWPAPASFSRASIAPLIPGNCHAAANGVITISSMNIDRSTSSWKLEPRRYGPSQ